MFTKTCEKPFHERAVCVRLLDHVEDQHDWIGRNHQLRNAKVLVKCGQLALINICHDVVNIFEQLILF